MMYVPTKTEIKNVVQRAARFMSAFAVAVLFASLGPFEEAAGQERADNRGSVRGVVSDGATGETLPGASVKLRAGAGAKVQYGARSDGTGSYEIKEVEAGDYVLEVSLEGYQSQRTPVSVLPGSVSGRDLGLAMKRFDTEDGSSIGAKPRTWIEIREGQVWSYGVDWPQTHSLHGKVHKRSDGKVVKTDSGSWRAVVNEEEKTFNRSSRARQYVEQSGSVILTEGDR